MRVVPGSKWWVDRPEREREKEEGPLFTKQRKLSRPSDKAHRDTDTFPAT
jgi:hypothetical protein